MSASAEVYRAVPKVPFSTVQFQYLKTVFPLTPPPVADPHYERLLVRQAAIREVLEFIGRNISDLGVQHANIT